MHVLADVFWTAKGGNLPEEYEDAYWPRAAVDTKTRQYQFAVGDGATETSFSALWAQMLVRSYCQGEFRPNRVQRSLTKLRQRWNLEVNKQPLPWYAEEKVRSGAFSSLLGLTVMDQTGNDAGGTWRALAVGDSCIFQVRHDRMIHSFPLSAAAEFNSRPVLISSVANSPLEASHIKSIEGAWQQGDCFYMMTDAVGCWFLKTLEENDRPWEVLRDFDTQDEKQSFPEWVKSLRAKGALKNDDVTLLRVSIP